MTAANPTLPAGAIDYPQSEEEIATGVRKKKEKKELLPKDELIQLLREYFDIGEAGRKGGDNPREEVWKANIDSYWGRSDSTGKAEWQADEVMPEVPNFVDRHTASMRLALMSQPNWFEVVDPTDGHGDINRIMTDFVEVHMNHCTTNASGQRIGFDATFASAVKAGTMTALAASVTYDPISKFVNVDVVDARELYYDPTGRGLFRIRRTEIDYWQLEKMKGKKDSSGADYYDNAAIERLQSWCDDELRQERERMTGSSEDSKGNSRRKPITLDEYLCAIIDREGKLLAENQLVVFANEREVIRGPEDNPNWHKKDWIVMCPTVDVPFSIWGRTFIENFRHVAETFNETTNLILDGMFSAAIPVYMLWLDALADPSEVSGGIHPGMTVTADEDWAPGKAFLEKVESGGVSPEAMRVWEALKAELREGASANELSLGQVPPKGDITAREIDESSKGSTVMSMGVAKDIDTRWLAPIVELVQMTALQHFDPENNPILAQELGESMSAMIAKHRGDFANKQYKYVAKGLTAAMERGRKLQGLTGFLQIIGQSEILAQAFARENSIPALVKELLEGFDVDAKRLKKTDEEKRAEMAQRVDARLTGGAGGAGGGGPTGPGARGGAPIPKVPNG